jgi:hypothetical protein
MVYSIINLYFPESSSKSFEMSIGFLRDVYPDFG